MYTSFNLAAAAYTPVLLIVRKIRYLFIEFTENVLYRDIYRYRDMNDLYRDMIFWSYRPALGGVDMAARRLKESTQQRSLWIGLIIKLGAHTCKCKLS